jgi:hypothetical protein
MKTEKELSISDRLKMRGITHVRTTNHANTGKHELSRGNINLGEFTAWEACEHFLTPWEKDRVSIA